MNKRLELLNKLADEFGGDKQGHGYLPYYAEYLPERCDSLLEIGVAKGQSALMWNAFYKDECDIWLLDLFKNPDFVNPRWCRKRFFVLLEGDQSDLEFLGTINKKFSVVIEDGSHRSDHQIISFKHHFVNNLGSGGLYVCEDMHCCNDPFYWGGDVKKFEDTILHMLKEYQSSKLIKNKYFNWGESEVFQNIISRVEVINDKIAFIWKK